MGLWKPKLEKHVYIDIERVRCSRSRTLRRHCTLISTRQTHVSQEVLLDRRVFEFKVTGRSRRQTGTSGSRRLGKGRSHDLATAPALIYRQRHSAVTSLFANTMDEVDEVESSICQAQLHMLLRWRVQSDWPRCLAAANSAQSPFVSRSSTH